MKITQVRNATLLVEYGGTRFLIDPLLADPGVYPPFPGTPNQFNNPFVPLPLDIADIVNVDAVIVTHLHVDHWDPVAQQAIDKSLPIFVQDEADASVVRSQGFEDVRVLTSSTEFKGIAIFRTGGQHGDDEVIAKAGADFGRVCGVVLKHADEKSLYLAGDTVWNQHVADALNTHAPDIIVLATGHAYSFGVGYILMGAEDALAVHRAAPNAVLVANHMEAVNPCTLTRGGLQAFADRHGFLSSIRTPYDGDVLTF